MRTRPRHTEGRAIAVMVAGTAKMTAMLPKMTTARREPGGLSVPPLAVNADRVVILSIRLLVLCEGSDRTVCNPAADISSDQKCHIRCRAG